jgi:hypothetical protein
MKKIKEKNSKKYLR